MKRQIFTLLMALLLATGVGLMAQTGNTTNSQQVDQSGQPETGPGPDVDVDTGANAQGAVDVDVNRTTDPDTAASGVDETGTLDQDDDMTDTGALPDTAGEMPLLALIGLVSLAGAVIIRVVR